MLITTTTIKMITIITRLPFNWNLDNILMFLGQGLQKLKHAQVTQIQTQTRTHYQPHSRVVLIITTTTITTTTKSTCFRFSLEAPLVLDDNSATLSWRMSDRRWLSCRCVRWSGCRRSLSSSLASRRHGPTGACMVFWPPTSWTPSIEYCTVSWDTDWLIIPRWLTASWTSSACPLSENRGRWMAFTWTRGGIGSSCPICCNSIAVLMFSPPRDVLQCSRGSSDCSMRFVPRNGEISSVVIIHRNVSLCENIKQKSPIKHSLLFDFSSNV